MHTRLASLTVLALGLAATGCTSFATVRSAQVHPGSSSTFQASITSPTGDGVGWFYGLDCSSDCSHSVAALDAAFTYGWAGEKPYTLGFGVNGLLFPYVEAYTQLSGDSARAFGVGARLGVGQPVLGWGNHQVYARYDIPLAGGTRVLWNPGVFLHAGNSPNGANPGHFLALVQGVGVEHRRERSTIVPAVALIVGRGDRQSAAEEDDGPFTAVFGAASVSITFHRPRSAPRGP
jgi:hypothetical protein